MCIHIFCIENCTWTGSSFLYILQILSVSFWSSLFTNIFELWKYKCYHYRQINPCLPLNLLYLQLLCVCFKYLMLFVSLHNIVNRGYQMSVGLILNSLNELNKSILCQPLATIILFYSTRSINLVMNQHEFNILFITYIVPQKELFIVKMIIFTDTPTI